MADGAFVSADIGKIAQFQSKSEKVIAEFNAIKAKFEEINSTMLKSWEGVGADAYKKETDHILEKIGSIKDILEAINTSVVMDIKDYYTELDNELDEFNRNPTTEEEAVDQ